MRASILLAALLIGGCSGASRQPQAPQRASGGDHVADPRGPTTPAMTGARQVAQRYFDALKKKDYATAYALWVPGGTNGSLADFRKGFAQYRTYAAQAGEPTAVKPSGGKDFILVEAKAAVMPAAGQPATWYGVLMLQRPSGAAADAWRIWGADIRARHCGKRETPRGLGCVPEPAPKG